MHALSRYFGLLPLFLIVGVAHGATSGAGNPLLHEWKGPYGGVPPFDQVKVEDFKPALLAAMSEHLVEIDAIANRKDPATFENTIVALERSGQKLQRVQTIYSVWASSLKSDAFQAVEKEMAPVLAAHGDTITQNAKLFARVAAIYDSPDKSKLTPEQQRLVWSYWQDFMLNGARLSPAD